MMDDMPAGKKKRNGEYVLPKTVVEYHGLKHIQDMEREAYYSTMEPPSIEVEEEAEEDLSEDEATPDSEDDTVKPQKKKMQGFAIKKKVKTAYIK